jgi:hypothetical protein
MSIKSTLSDLRQKQINSYTLSEREKISTCESTWGPWCFMPIDLPRFEDLNFIDWYFDRAKPIYKVSSDISTDSVGHSNYLSVNIYPHGAPPANVGHWTRNEVCFSEWSQKFSQIYQQIMDCLPIKKLYNINIWSSCNPIIAHRDHIQFIDCPLAFRIMMHDENPKPTLYVEESLPDNDNATNLEKHWCQLPEQTNTFVWNNLRVKHGSQHDSKFRKILMLIQAYDIDWNKADSLLDRSTRAFSQEFYLKSNRPLTDFVDV